MRQANKEVTELLEKHALLVHAIADALIARPEITLPQLQELVLKHGHTIPTPIFEDFDLCVTRNGSRICHCPTNASGTSGGKPSWISRFLRKRMAIVTAIAGASSFASSRRSCRAMSS